MTAHQRGEASAFTTKADPRETERRNKRLLLALRSGQPDEISGLAHQSDTEGCGQHQNEGTLHYRPRLSRDKPVLTDEALTGIQMCANGPKDPRPHDLLVRIKKRSRGAGGEWTPVAVRCGVETIRLERRDICSGSTI